MGVQCLTWIMASKLGKWPSRAPEKHNLEIRRAMMNPLGMQQPLQSLVIYNNSYLNHLLWSSHGRELWLPLQRQLETVYPRERYLN